jgi:leucyl/phenylalanyl-tRNA--protein transferase
MPVYLLDERIVFPPVEHAEEGLLAVGGDLSPRRLLLAYSRGIFPWYQEGQPILWHAPDPRMVLLPNELRVSRSLRRRLRQRPFRITCDTAFEAVIESCASAPRPGQRGTWITADIKRAYAALHRMGLAHSVETWSGEELAGGLYGVSLGAVFFGESMFARQPDASKVAFVHLVGQLRAWGFALIDCQVYTDYLADFGALEWPRRRFTAALETALSRPTRRGPWKITVDPVPPSPGR